MLCLAAIGQAIDRLDGLPTPSAVTDQQIEASKLSPTAEITCSHQLSAEHPDRGLVSSTCTTGLLANSWRSRPTKGGRRRRCLGDQARQAPCRHGARSSSPSNSAARANRDVLALG
jgi:hypothetical protein